MKNGIKKTGLGFKLVFLLLLAIYSVLLISVLVYAFLNSFKTDWGFILDPIGLPTEWNFTNYKLIFDNLTMQENVKSPIYNIFDMFFGSLFYSFISAASIVIATTLMAYACAIFPNKFSKVIYFIALFMITVPIIGALPSEMRVIRALGLYNNVLSSIIFKFQFGNIYFLLLYEMIKGIPKDYKEAAEVDGASKFRTMTQIMLPMVINIIGSIFLVQFIAFWNDYSTPVMYFPHLPNLAVGLIDFALSTSGIISAEPFKLGACIIAMVPMLVVFLVFSKRLLNGVAAGGIKG